MPSTVQIHNACSRPAPIASASVLMLLIVSVGVHFAMTGLGLLFFGAEGYGSNLVVRSRDLDALAVDMSSRQQVDPASGIELAKTGHSDRKMLSVEFTLEACNEKSSGIIADLTTA